MTGIQQLIEACQKLDAKCARREERTRAMQELANEARRTGKSQSHRMKDIEQKYDSTVLDIGDEVAEIRRIVNEL